MKCCYLTFFFACVVVFVQIRLRQQRDSFNFPLKFAVTYTVEGKSITSTESTKLKVTKERLMYGTPRIKINKGSVGIVEKFCTIYTFESPGGWNIIGRTPLNLFDINKKNSSKLVPGDTVKFKSISKKSLKYFINE